MGALCSGGERPVVGHNVVDQGSAARKGLGKAGRKGSQHADPVAGTQKLGDTIPASDMLSDTAKGQQQQNGQPGFEAGDRAAAKQPAAHTAQPQIDAGKFADLIQLCSMVCKVPLCTVSLVASEAPWLPSTAGPAFKDTPFGTCTLQQFINCPLVVPDTVSDPRFSSSIYVSGPPHIRFYAGVPLFDPDGKPVAALCIMDTKPASEGLLPAEARKAMLTNFADMASRELEREHALAMQQAAKEALGSERQQLLRMMDLIGDGKAVLLLEVPPIAGPGTEAADRSPRVSAGSTAAASGPHSVANAAHWPSVSSHAATVTPAATRPWRILGMNEAWESTTGLHNEDAEGKDFWSLFNGAGDEELAAQARAACAAAAGAKQDFMAVLQLRLPPGNTARQALAAAGAFTGKGTEFEPGDAVSQSVAPREPVTMQLVLRCVDAQGSSGPKGDSAGNNAQPAAGAQDRAASPPTSAAPAGPCYYYVSLASESTNAQLRESIRTMTGTDSIATHKTLGGHGLDSMMSSQAVSLRELMLATSSGAWEASGSSAVAVLQPTRPTAFGDRTPLLDDQGNVSRHLQVVSLIGHGSFGRVYFGTYNGEAVAIKVLEWEGQGGAGHVLEALLTTQIEHKNCVRTYKHGTRPLRMARQSFNGDGQSGPHPPSGRGFGSGGGLGPGGDTGCERQMMETWMVMEYADQGTLTDAVENGWLRGGGQNSQNLSGNGNSTHYEEPDTCAILATAAEVASAMKYLHSKDILHGDLTGSNILLCSNEDDKRGFYVKVADFGLSRVLATDIVQTKTYGAVSHTPPELLLTGLLSKAVDVYAFGVILWEMIMGEPPYRGLTQAQIINHISSGRGLSLHSDCPSVLRKLVGSCLSLKPEERPTFAQVLDQLESMQEEGL